MSSWQRLSGYLNCKPTGPFKRLKGIQRHWYVFEESTLKLLAYRNEMDAAIPDKEPLKIINIHGAVFYIDPVEHNQFSIISDGKEHILQAETEDAMLLWLHVLQTRRNEVEPTNETEISPINDDNLTDYKMFRQNSLMKIQTSIPTKLPSTTSLAELNESFTSNGSLNNSRQQNMKIRKLTKQESIEQLNEIQAALQNVPSDQQTLNIFNLSWISSMDNISSSSSSITNNTQKSTSKRLSFTRSSSYDSEIVKRHVSEIQLNEKYLRTSISKPNNNNNYILQNSIDQSIMKSMSPRDHIMNVPIKEENEDGLIDEKLCYDQELLKKSGKNRSLPRTTMKVLDNLSENKFQVTTNQQPGELMSQNDLKANDVNLLSEINKESKENISTTNSPESDESNQTEKENQNVITKTDNHFFGNSPVKENKYEDLSPESIVTCK
ncbi:unnamed protein product [Schistosoma turkestanicum]|nr:unnamed protein product [Schistosoma turkestanicum]